MMKRALLACGVLFLFIVVTLFSSMVWAAGEVQINGGAQFTNSITVTLNLDASNIFADLSTAEVSVDSTGSSSWTFWIPYVTSMSYDLPSGDGAKTVYVRFRIYGGNYTSEVYQNSITLDTTPPSLTITSPNNGIQISSSTLSVSWTAQDAGSGIAYCQIIDQNSNVVNVGTATTYELTGLTDGSHAFRIEAFDNAGNSRTASLDFAVNTGGTGPPSTVDLFPWIYLIPIVVVVAIVTIAIRRFGNRRPPSLPTGEIPQPGPSGEYPPSPATGGDEGKEPTRRKADDSKRPLKLHIGDFVITVENYTAPTVWKPIGGITKGVSGTGWVGFKCSGFPQLSQLTGSFEGFVRIKDSLKVVSVVDNPQTEISLENARIMNPEISLGENLELDLQLDSIELNRIMETNLGFSQYLSSRKGDVLVEFENVTVRDVDTINRIGRILEGKAIYPGSFRYPEIIKLYLGNFVALIDSLTLTPKEGFANIKLQLPKNIASGESCNPATLNLGGATITPDCQFYADKSADQFGPWIIGDTGMMANGIGFTADFSSQTSPPSKTLASWMGIVLKSGEATGEQISPTNSNSGFVTGKYTFSNAAVSSDGLEADLELKEKHSFQTIQPQNYIISMEKGKLFVSESRITSGALEQGYVEFPRESICQNSPGIVSSATFISLAIRENLDIVGEVNFEDKSTSWGELTNKGNEVVSWSVRMNGGYLYLPSGPTSGFSPDKGTGTFISLSIPSQIGDPSAPFDYLEANDVPGVTMRGDELKHITIYSPDRVEGTGPIRLPNLHGWLRIGSIGVDGELFYNDLGKDAKQDLGNVDRIGYVGGEPFDTLLTEKNRNLLGQFVDSAVYDSEVSGNVTLDYPCDFSLAFADMEFTSTVNLVGGNVSLPSNQVNWGHWALKIKADIGPDGNAAQAGVMSIRTGRLILTDVRIVEEVHFGDSGFKLIWGEIFASGNVGELFFDYNNYGQRFDGLPYSPHYIKLSQYRGNRNEEAFLATYGGVSFVFFGEALVNIKDAKYHVKEPPYNERLVTIPKISVDVDDKPIDGWPKTNLHLHGEWNNNLAIFDFPDEIMGYNDKVQNGFKGENGSTEISFIKSNALHADITTREESIDICFHVNPNKNDPNEKESHTLDFSVLPNLKDLPNLGQCDEIMGCVRIIGPTLKTFSVNGYISEGGSAAIGLLRASATHSAQFVLTITPTSCTFMSSGALIATVSGAAIDLSGYINLNVDYAGDCVEGELLGRIDCKTVVGGLGGEGQLSWFIGPSVQYLQGRVSLKICCCIGSAGIEGGFFVGHNCPKDKAYVLTSTGNEHFDISERLLTDTITGIYGYGLMSASMDFGVFSGGYELYAGMGALLSETGLPDIIGSCGLYLHGEILWGLVSASAWGNLDFILSPTSYPKFEGKIGLEGCALWVLCVSIEITAGLDEDGFYVET